MAKKKVTHKIEKTEQIAVDGNVLLQVKSGDVVLKTLQVHNTATLNLFTGLILSLNQTSSTDITTYLPNYICAGTGYDASSSDVSRFALIAPINMPREKINKTNSPIILTDNVQLTFDAVIPYLSIGSNVKVRELGLFGTSGIQDNTMVARVQFDPLELKKGQSLYVQWTFSIQGATSTSNSTTN